MDQIHLSPLVDQIQLSLGHISNTTTVPFSGGSTAGAAANLHPRLQRAIPAGAHPDSYKVDPHLR
jgi:hypothetical protein